VDVSTTKATLPPVDAQALAQRAKIVCLEASACDTETCSDALLRYPEHIRPMPQGMPPPSDVDPITWIDEVIAICAPPKGCA
jgi:hypothetical protein